MAMIADTKHEAAGATDGGLGAWCAGKTNSTGRGGGNRGCRGFVDGRECDA